jgi:hypothetical protein
MAKYKLVSLDGDELDLDLTQIDDIQKNDVIIIKMDLGKYNSEQIEVSRECIKAVFGDDVKVLIMDESCQIYKARRV